MAKNIRAIRGMNDCLPAETLLWQHAEGILKQVVTGYGYREIRLPVVEQTLLFSRAIGELTDVVEKEMYTFQCRSSDSLTLRPEGTAGCVRACLEHDLLGSQQRLWYSGPMFRHERPQKGRYRQFHQLGAEVFGLAGPEIDAELILLTARCWRALGVTAHVRLELNSIGSAAARKGYVTALVAFLEQHRAKLDEECQQRLYGNPLRLLDSKNPDVQLLLNDAPRLENWLDADSRQHFTQLCELLTNAGIPFRVNERLVRGLDYYNQTVFEWITDSLGAQGAVCAGGRYDGLVEQLGGRATPAVGFAIGLERLLLLLRVVHPEFTPAPALDACLISAGSGTLPAAMQLAEQLRDTLPGLKLMTYFGGGSFKKQLSRADKSGARMALVLGENEITAGQVILKDLRSGEQQTVALSDITARVASMLSC